MPEKDDNLDVSTEEQNAEAEAQKEVGEDELRESLADELELDPNEDNEFLDKLVEREKSQREMLSGAIKQKIRWREKAKKASEEPEDTPREGEKPSKNGDPENIDKLIEQKLEERLERQTLQSLNLPDELKAEVKDLAKVKGISVGEAAKLPYIQSRKKEVEREQRVKDATPKRSRKGSKLPKYDPAKPLNPDDFNFDSEEGVKAWQEAKEARRKYEAKNN